MKSLREYIVESEQWMSTPAEGDDFAIEMDDGTLVETYIIEVVDDCILLDSTEEINQALAEWATLEDTDEGDSGVIMEDLGTGGMFSPLGEGAMKREMHDAAERMSLEQFKELYGYEDWIEEFWREANGEPTDLDENIDPIIVKALEKMPKGLSGKGLPGDAVFDAARKALALEYGLMKMRYDTEVTTKYVRQLIDLYQRQAAVDKKGSYPGVDEDQDAAQVAKKELDMDAAEKLGMSEAEYRGRKVQLGKPMAGDVKKFKVYVKDPKTGNVKKVNFGHGGKSARRAGQKTMRIRKSNPKARKSFRARHNCANPGPRTKARYWSCRKW